MDSHKISGGCFVVAAVSIAIGFSSAAWAAAPNTATMITTKKMCPVCAKKITEAFRKLDGVTDSRADVATKTFVVFPAVGRALSPR